MTVYRLGDRVRAFHPGMFGVVCEGRVTAYSTHTPKPRVRVDFGTLRGGNHWVPAEHVLEVVA